MRKPMPRHKPGASICSGTPATCARLRRSYSANASNGLSVNMSRALAVAMAWGGSLDRQQVLDARQQFLRADRLGDEVLGALAQAPDAVGLHRFGRDDQDRDRRGVVVATQRASG